MKWLKNISKWLKPDEEYEIKEIIIDDNETLDINELKQKGIKVTTEKDSKYFKQKQEETVKIRKQEPSEFSYRQKDEINADVSFQYPKGKFRFPVIPDNNYVKEKKRPARVHNRTRETVRESFPQIRGASPEREQKPTIVDKKPARTQISSQHDKKRPFKLSDIPSPVYGFQKRPIQTNRKNTGFDVRAGSLSRGEDLQIPAILRQEKMNGTVEQVASDHHILKTGNNDLVDVQSQQSSGWNTDLRMESEITDEKLWNPGETVIEEEEAIEGAGQEATAAAEQQEALFMEETSLMITEMDDIVEEEAEVSEYTETEAIAMIETEAASSARAEEFFEEYGDEHEFVEAEVLPDANTEMMADETIHNENEGEEEAAIAMEAVETEPKKKYIPFNVVMLSRDKERWSQTEKKKTVNNEDDQRHNLVEENSDKPVEEAQIAFYQYPDLNLLTPPLKSESDREWLRQQAIILNETLHNFSVRAKVVNATQGPAVTQFEVQPEPGVKVNKITNLADDIKLCLAARDIRMEAPIPGKHTIGIEIPNRNSRAVFLREILESEAFRQSESPLTVALGLDITGAPVITDLRKMPHGLIAGATGSGKSVCINTMLVSLLYKATPQEVKVLLIDPKVVELAPYNSIPHLVSPVITDVKAATAALKWAVEEMERRYELFAHMGVRDISRFNQKAEENKQYSDKLPYILIIIDELADLMMMSPADVEESICRIAQKARACGIHMIVATQRPSVDVITGLIKSNIPTRIAFSVSSQVDSRTIIDSSGAEKLLGRGDMLFMENGSSKTVRLQGTYVDDEEIEKIVGFVKREQKPDYLFHQDDLLVKANVSDQTDELFLDACEFVVFQNTASASSLQRRFHIGYSRAGRIIDMMESNGIVSENRGSRPREVLMTVEDFKEWSQLQTENVQ